MITLSGMSVSLIAKTVQYLNSIDGAMRKNAAFADSTEKMRRRVGQAFKGLLVGIGIAQIRSFYNEHAAGIDLIAKNSDSLGVATEKFIGMRHAAQLGGVEINTLDDSIKKLNIRAGQAAAGFGPLAKAFDDNNLNLQAFLALPVEERYAAIADQMSQFTSQTEKANFANQLFGRSGVDLIPMLDQGADALRNSINEAETYGFALSRIDAAKVEASNDTFLRTNQTLKGLARRVAIEAAPVVGALGEEFLAVTKDAGGFGAMVTRAFDHVATGAGIVANGVHGIKLGFMGLQVLAARVMERVIDLWLVPARLGGKIAKVFGFDIEGIKNIEAFRESLRTTSEDLTGKLQDGLMQPLPSERIKAWLEDVKTKADLAAEEIANSRNDVSDLLLNDVDLSGNPEVERERTVLTELESMRKSHQTKRLREDAKFHFMVERFQKASSLGRIGLVAGEIGAMFNLSSSGSKKMFDIQKKAGIVSALVSTYQGIARGVALGWPAAIPAVAWATLNGFKQVRALKSQTFNGGGESAGGIAASSGVVDVSAQIPAENAAPANDENSPAEAGRVTQIILPGNVYGFDDFKTAVSTAVAEASDAGQVVVTDRSGRLIVEAV